MKQNKRKLTNFKGVVLFYEVPSNGRCCPSNASRYYRRKSNNDRCYELWKGPAGGPLSSSDKRWLRSPGMSDPGESKGIGEYRRPSSETTLTH